MPSPSHGPHAPQGAADAPELSAYLPWAGRLLRLRTPWVRRGHWLVPAVAVVAVLFGLFARVDLYESGPAVVRLERRAEVTARTAGVLSEVQVRPGQRVTAGAPLARFSARAEADDLRARVVEWEAELRRYLTNPGNRDAYQALLRLEGSRRLAERMLVEQVVRAPRDGVVVDVRARAGAWLNAGDLICSVVPDDAQPLIEVFLPGRARPMLTPGAELTLELAGERYRYHPLIVVSVDAEVVGPAEVKRALGPAYGQLIKASGAVVRVQALPQQLGRAPLAAFDGATGTATVRLERRSLWGALLRQLRSAGG
jgi:hypothetical protein